MPVAAPLPYRTPPPAGIAPGTMRRRNRWCARREAEVRVAQATCPSGSGSNLSATPLMQ